MRRSSAPTVDARPIHQPPQPSRASTRRCPRRQRRNRLDDAVGPAGDVGPWNDTALWIHSPGGSVPAMLALRDLLQVIPNDVSTLAFGIACSTGPLLLSSGAPGTRRALPHSRIIVHQGSAGIGWRAVDVALRADYLRDARGDRVLDIHSHLLSEWVIWIGTAIDAGVANALIAQLLFREPNSPDSKVQLSVNCDSGDPPRHRNQLCGAGNRCRRRPARRRSRKEPVRTAARSGRAPPARSPGAGAGPYPSSSSRPTRLPRSRRAHRGKRPESRPTASRHGSRPCLHGPSGPAVRAANHVISRR